LNPPICIWVDDRERPSAVFRELEGREEIRLEVRRLSVGDYEVDGRLLVERKTLPDLAVSLIDGRLFRQMNRLAASNLKGVLILEGRSRDLEPAGVRRQALQGALLTVSLVLGIPILRAISPAETAWLLVQAARQARVVASGALPRSGYRPKGRRQRQLFILQSLPGVGPTRAARLLEHFGSVQQVLNAGAEGLAAVEGIGQGIARRIQDAIAEQGTAYGIEGDWIQDF
jgi:ERCC4-type nuclease